ncbi:hypothetical protein LCGC14_0628320 [marine sediment metagenome]|uniref:ATP-grasp domain-containing protein n=1 Tax=marine sediment metagenome TaxID=412755 RepID=A0A0F9UB83_9ZZZZ
MVDKSNSILVVGFNTRPLVYSLNKAGYDVYAIDFFGDLDLIPYVKDCIIVSKELQADYNSLKDHYSKYLASFAIKFLQKHQDIEFFLIGSGLDDAYEERGCISNEAETFGIKSVNNDLAVIKKARNIDFILKFLKSLDFKIPIFCSFEDFELKNVRLEFPLILKKKRSAGGINVFKIKDESSFEFHVKGLRMKDFDPSEWIIQEFIEGIPISCTVISDGKECEVVSINRQIIGEKFLNPPKNFMYCGNIVPAGLSKNEEKKISEISIILTKELGLKGVNGFDFVLKNQYPYFMECNPRIPGSIRASESVFNLNLLDLHVKSYTTSNWRSIKNLIKSATPKSITTKLVLFAPKDIDIPLLCEINNLGFIHDKTEPNRNVLKGEPLCTILYGADNLIESFDGAKKIIKKINKIIE